jgi:tetratricopeptide (TPR) repeat protein
MNPFPPPSDDILNPEQKKVVAKLKQSFNDPNFPRAFNTPVVIDAAVNMLSSVCQQDADVDRMFDYVERWVGWDPFYGLKFAFYLQHMTRKIGAWKHIRACVLFSDAQVTVNDDMAFHSTEVAYHTFLTIKDELFKGNVTDPQKSALRNLEDLLLTRLTTFYKFYQQWSKPFDPMQFNPLTDNLYYRFCRRKIQSEFPNIHFDYDKAESAFLEVISHCNDENSIYYRVLARRNLGHWYICEGLRGGATRNINLNHAIDQLNIGLDEAISVGLKAEIGHLHRLVAFAYRSKGEWQEAANHFMEALNSESGEPASYWRCLSACELASVLRMNLLFKFDLSKLSSTSTATDEVSLEFFRRARFEFDVHMNSSSELPISSAIKLQMFRCYIENAIEQARYMNQLYEVLSDIEANSPREIVHVLAEMQAANALDLSVTSEGDLGQLREIFHRQLNTVPESFDKYRESFGQQYSARHAYLQRSLALEHKTFSLSSTSDRAVEQMLDMDLPGKIFVFFNIGRTSHCAILNFDVPSLKCGIALFYEQQLQKIQQAYVDVISKRRLEKKRLISS